MLHFLSSLFKPSTGEAGALDQALIEAATERAIDGTDPRLRALGYYRNRLHEPVAQAARHVIALVDALPAPVEISRRGYGTDPRLRAFFVSADHLQEVLGGIKTLRDYLQGVSAPPPDAIFGLLTLTWKERTVLGTEQQGEILRRDVKQAGRQFLRSPLCRCGRQRGRGALGTEEARLRLPAQGRPGNHPYDPRRPPGSETRATVAEQEARGHEGRELGSGSDVRARRGGTG